MIPPTQFLDLNAELDWISQMSERRCLVSWVGLAGIAAALALAYCCMTASVSIYPTAYM